MTVTFSNIELHYVMLFVIKGSPKLILTVDSFTLTLRLQTFHFFLKKKRDFGVNLIETCNTILCRFLERFSGYLSCWTIASMDIVKTITYFCHLQRY